MFSHDLYTCTCTCYQWIIKRIPQICNWIFCPPPRREALTGATAESSAVNAAHVLGSPKPDEAPSISFPLGGPRGPQYAPIWPRQDLCEGPEEAIIPYVPFLS